MQIYIVIIYYIDRIIINSKYMGGLKLAKKGGFLTKISDVLESSKILKKIGLEGAIYFGFGLAIFFYLLSNLR